ncbi:hypothetical protein ACQP3L_37465, partial [Escherichia coli]
LKGFWNTAYLNWNMFGQTKTGYWVETWVQDPKPSSPLSASLAILISWVSMVMYKSSIPDVLF